MYCSWVFLGFFNKVFVFLFLISLFVCCCGGVVWLFDGLFVVGFFCCFFVFCLCVGVFF